LSKWYSQQNFSHQIGQALEESRIDDRGSDKEVVAFDSDSIAILPKAVTQAIVPQRLSIECSGTQTLQDSALPISAAEHRAGSMFRGTKRPFGNVINASTAPRRDLSWRGVSRLASTNWSHVSSVLSATNSWRSSLALRLSFSTGRSSSTDRNSWTSQFIDQSKFVSTAWTLPHLESVSLYNRPCCFFMDPCAHPERSCEVCDYSESHHLARTFGAGDLDLIDASIQDLFGNLPLHHAAAVGNIECVRHLLSNARRDMTHGLNHRNSSGETFLHVYRIRKPDDFPEYLVIARQAIEQGLRLSIRDYQGKSMKERMIEMLHHCKIGQIQLREALELFDSLDTSQGTISDVLILVEGSNIPVTWLMPSIDEDLEEDEKEGFHLGLVKINSSEMDQKQLQTAIKAHSPDTSISLDRLRSPTIAKLSILERDSNGETHLISVLKRWPKASLVSSHLKKLIQHSDIHMRDCHGYTALAIAARRGLRDAVSLLLERGANPNTRSVQKKSLLDHVLGYLNLTQKESSEENDILYARILSCMVLLIDNGATVNATELDDYSMLSCM
jgi:ankyrin repeat protein